MEIYNICFFQTVCTMVKIHLEELKVLQTILLDIPVGTPNRVGLITSRLKDVFVEVRKSRVLPLLILIVIR